MVLGNICFLGCGNLGSAMLKALTQQSTDPNDYFVACVASAASETRLQNQYAHSTKVTVIRGNSDRIGNNSDAVISSNTIILAVDPSQLESVLLDPQIQEDSRAGKDSVTRQQLFISVVAGWTRERIETTLYGSPTTEKNAQYRGSVIRTLPNVGASVGQSMTAIETLPPWVTEKQREKVEEIMGAFGKFTYIQPSQMPLATAVAGSTPAFFGILADALVDASVAVGMPRDTARTMIAQSMLGSATILNNGTSPSELRDQGTSPEGCTMAGVCVLEEMAVRGAVGKALREACTVARRMGTEEHLNDTRH